MNPADDDLREVEKLNARYHGATMAADLIADTLHRTPRWRAITRWRLWQRITELEATAADAYSEAARIVHGWERS